MDNSANNEFYLITGTSRGIGEALASRILEDGNTVLGISRNRSDRLSSLKYHHLPFDLKETSQIDQIMEELNRIIGDQHFDFVCLVNNASAVDPTGPIEKSPAAEIESHVKIGLIAPMILTSMFMRRFAADKIRKKVVFISSGAAYTALPGDSVYCSSKAGMNMFAQCIGLEQSNKENGFEINSVGPGMVDTSMQLTLRSKKVNDFALAGFFKQAHEEGKLQDASKVAEKIYQILGNVYVQGTYVNVHEM